MIPLSCPRAVTSVIAWIICRAPSTPKDGPGVDVLKCLSPRPPVESMITPRCRARRSAGGGGTQPVDGCEIFGRKRLTAPRIPLA